MALASRMEYLFSTVGSHLPMEHILFARVVLIRQCCLSFAKKAFICRKKSHLPISPRICRLHIICQRVVSFPDFNYLPKDCLSFPDRKSHLPLSTLSFSKPSPTFTKRGRKNIFNTPKWLPWTRKSNCRALYYPYRLPIFFFFFFFFFK